MIFRRLKIVILFCLSQVTLMKLFLSVKTFETLINDHYTNIYWSLQNFDIGIINSFLHSIVYKFPLIKFSVVTIKLRL